MRHKPHFYLDLYVGEKKEKVQNNKAKVNCGALESIKCHYENKPECSQGAELSEIWTF